ncbi:MAG: DNA/RNA non-specific endonuclease, partial [Lactobacillus panisapium]|nr:DNA/RNA non-specific endonuclease [Lactobacillus panisapium]
VNRVIYSDLDSLNRTSHSNTAFLQKRNVANDSLRVRQFVEPTGWHYNRRNGTQIYNRGHLIAYSVSAGIDLTGDFNPRNLSGDQNNPKNLFTQSAFSNQRIQTMFESRVRVALRQNKKVIYQATPIFRGTELMARGINLQAVSTDGELDFNVYLFNVQPGYSFNYNNGRAKVDHEIFVKDNY